MSTEDSRKSVIGYTAAFSVMVIWATWLVASRAGAQSPLTIYDHAVLRYGVSSIVALPIVLYYRPWRTMSWKRIAIVSFLLGPIYILAVFLAFQYAPAAHGGIFMNGALPAVTLFISWILFKQRVHKLQLLGVLLIIIGATLAVIDAAELSLVDAWIGDGLFFISAVFFSAYLIAARVWNVTTTQVLFCSSVINAMLFVPIWFWFLPSGFAEASQSQFLIQMLYQGLIPGLIGLLLVATATRNIGPSSTAAFMAGVPALGSILGVVLLNEMLGGLGWLSILVLTPGILLVAFFSAK
ncbi:MAG: DMT family transporter [Granulosicoccaceae bacterium]